MYLWRILIQTKKISQSQCDRILRYLQSGKRLTSLEALDKFGCLRLSARILDLKNRWHQISDEFVHDARTGKSI